MFNIPYLSAKTENVYSLLTVQVGIIPCYGIGMKFVLKHERFSKDS